LFFRTPFDYFLLAYVCIGIFNHRNRSVSRTSCSYTKRLLLISILYLVLLSFDSRKKVLNGLLIIFGAVAVISIIEIIYYYVAHEGRFIRLPALHDDGRIKK